MHLIGIDLGGTKIEGAIVDPAQPTAARFRTRVPTESANGYDHIIGQVGKLVDALRREYPGDFPNRIGIGTPGTRDPKTGLQRGSNTQCLNGRPFQADLERALGLEIEIANDANCFALAEATLGAARGYDTVFGIIMGTGCGGGFVVNGHVLYGCHGIAGEWGQIVIEPQGEVSGYGTRGIIETIIAGPALEKYYAGVAGERRPLKEIVERAAQGADAHAAATITRLTDYFARAVAIIIDSFDPHAIVIGGGVGNIDALYSEETREKISSHIFAPRFEAALLKPTLGDSAGVFGAAMLTVT
jgi:predicted NBD/HSP70 family sugar kinase